MRVACLKVLHASTHITERERECWRARTDAGGKRGRAKGSQQPASHDIDPWHAPQHGRKTAPGSSPQNPQSDAGPPPIVIVLGSPPTRTFRRWFRCTCDKVHAHGCRRAALASEAPPNFAKEPRILSVQSWKHGSGGLGLVSQILALASGVLCPADCSGA